MRQQALSCLLLLLSVGTLRAQSSAAQTIALRPIEPVDLAQLRTSVDCSDSAGHPIAVPRSLDSVPTFSTGVKPPFVRSSQTVLPPRVLPGVRGWVDYRFVIDTAGLIAPCSVSLVRASHPEFRAPALKALLSTRYAPAMNAGRPVAVQVLQRVAFPSP
jgi:hypothetical protein